MKKELEKRVDKAVALFMEGYGCSQSVTAAFADLYGFSEQQALSVGEGFGGGVGKMRMMCGAVSGLVILSGMYSGKESSEIREHKTNCYRIVQQLLEQFRQENGSVVCAELLGLNGPAPKGDFVPSERSVQYYKVRPCAAKVESAARIFAEFLSENDG